MSDSNNRQKSAVVHLRCTQDELAEIKGKADLAGISIPALLRESVLDAPPLRQQHRPPVEKALLSKILRGLGKTNVSNNITQIYEHLNSYTLALNRGRELDLITTKKIIEQTHAEIKHIREALLKALGRKV